MCDGYSGYNKLKKAKRTTCWSHVLISTGAEHARTLDQLRLIS